MSNFLSNMIKLSSSTLTGQVIGLLVTPILARIYTPADFGIFQLFVSIVALIAPISCFSYFYAILLPEKEEDSANITVLCIFLIALVSCITTAVFFIFSGNIESSLNAPGFSRYLPLLPLAILFSGCSYVFGHWASKKEEFGIIAKANVLSSCTGKGFSIGSGLFSPTPFGLILGTIINDATIVIILLKRSMTDFTLFYNTSYQKIIDMVRRYKKFPQYSMGADLAGNAAVQIIPFILAFMFSPVIVGYYSMAYLILRLPSKLIGNSIGTVFFQQASAERKLTGGVKNVVKTVHRRLISFGIFICLIMMIAGPEMFSFVLGPQWTTAGIYAQIFAPWFFVAFISIPLAYIYSVLEKQSVSLWFSLLLFTSSVVVLIIGGSMDNPLLSMVMLSATGTLLWGWMNMYSLKIAGLSGMEAGYEILRYLLIGLVVCLPVLIAKFLLFQEVSIIVITGIVSLTYYMIIIYQDVNLRDGLSKIARSLVRK